MSEAAAQGESALTAEVKAVIGATAEKIEASFPWGIEREGLRIFTQAIMDPDPRYWDDEFAKKTKFGGIVTPPIYCTYIGRRTRPGAEDPDRILVLDQHDGADPGQIVGRRSLRRLAARTRLVLDRLMARQVDLENGALARRAVDEDKAAGLLDDAVHG